MPQFFDATPAYGRDYKSQKDILRDWHADKDFQMHAGLSSTYVNRADLMREPHTHLILTYNNGMRSMVLHSGLKPPAWLKAEQSAKASGETGMEKPSRTARRRSVQEEVEDALGLQPGEGAF